MRRFKCGGFLAAIAFAAAVALAQTRPATEMIQNGNFEAEMTSWSAVSPGNVKGSAAVVTEDPLDAQSAHSLRIEATEVGFGVANTTAAGLTITSGTWYDVSFFARIENPASVGLLFSLESLDGKRFCARTTLPEIGRVGTPVEGSQRWRKYTVSLHAYASDPKCRLVISPIEPATVVIDSISMTPRK